MSFILSNPFFAKFGKAYLSVGLVAALLLFLPTTTGASPVTDDPTFESLTSRTLIAEGLNNPRHVSIGPDGTIYVAESGVGGAEPCVEGAEGIECLGMTGSITAINSDGQSRIIEGLPSLAGVGGFAATGPADVAVAQDGTIRAVIGLGNDPAVRDSVLSPAGGELLGQLVSFGADGVATATADIAGFEAANNPDGTTVDSNPTALIHSDGGYLIADAGMNALLTFDGTDLGVAAVFPEILVVPPPFIPAPEIPMQAVPTSVAVGPDGAFYVGQLTGFPFPMGGAVVFRVDPATGDVTTFAEGFTNIIDIEFGPDGSLYVLQISSSGILSEQFDGALIKVNVDGSSEIVEDNLFAPGGVAVDADGNVFVSNCGICPGAGEVLLLQPDAPEMALSFSTMTDRSGAADLDGAEISGLAHMFVNPLDPGNVARVDFLLDGVPTHTEFVQPYDFPPRAQGPWDSATVTDGAHNLSAVVVLTDGSFVLLSADFTVTNGVAPIDSGLAYSVDRSRSDPADLNGATVQGTIWAFVFPVMPPSSLGIEKVVFYLDGQEFRTEFLAPYDFGPAAVGWDTLSVANGDHTITAEAMAGGNVIASAEATFTVANE